MPPRFTAFETARPAEDRLYIISLTWCDCTADRFCPRCKPAAAALRSHPLPAHSDDEEECEINLQVRIERQLLSYGVICPDYDYWSLPSYEFEYCGDRDGVDHDDRYTEGPARGPPLECHTKDSFRQVRQRWIEEQQRQFNCIQRGHAARAMIMALSSGSATDSLVCVRADMMLHSCLIHA